MTTTRAATTSGPGHPRAQRRLLALLAPLLLAAAGQVALATPAHAGQVGVNLTISGNGWVEVVEGSVGENRVCSAEDHVRNDQTKSCDRWRAEAAFEAWVWLRAHHGGREWIQQEWQGCDEKRWRDGTWECGVHSGALSSTERHPSVAFVDRYGPAAPTIELTTVPDRERTVRWRFSSTSEDTSGYTCVLNGEPFTPCEADQTLELEEGGYALQLWAHDPSGNASWRVYDDFEVVDTEILSGFSGVTSSRRAAFQFGTGNGERFGCRLDGGAWYDCATVADPTEDLADLADGEHVLQVRAAKRQWLDAVPAERRWTVDTVAPSVSVSRMYVDSSEAAFRMDRSEEGLTGECRWLHGSDDTGWSPCGDTAVRSGLATGQHRFEARVRDAAGNVSPVAGEDFTVGAPDTTAPRTTLTGGPGEGAVVASRTARLTASSSEEGGTLECTVDGRRTDCVDGRLELVDLTAGAHRVSVVAVDAAGNRDATPAVRRWVVPRSSRELHAARGFRQTDDAASWSGGTAVATKKGATLSTRVSRARTLALVVAPARGQGSVTVAAGDRTVATVDLSRGTGRTVVRTLPRLAAPYTGLVTITSTSAKPVRVQGLGWTG
jgi:hypothetical protein